MVAFLTILMALLDEKPGNQELAGKHGSIGNSHIVTSPAMRIWRGQHTPNRKSEALSVTILPTMTQVHVGELVEIQLLVAIQTDRPQLFEVMDCSWLQHWKTNNPLLAWLIWTCRQNIPYIET